MTAQAPQGRPTPPAPPTDSTRRVVRRLLAAALTVLLGLASVSYARALLAPGPDSVLLRTVGWVRDHGGSPLVDQVENWWYTRHPPSELPAGHVTLAGTPLAPTAHPPAPLPALSGRAADGEGRWQAGYGSGIDDPAMLVTYLLPDQRHPSVVAAVARFDQSRVRAMLIAGSQQPSEQPWPEGNQVPPEDRPGLVATFNSGFKLRSARGGFYAHGREAVPLEEGAASLVIDRQGRVTVDRWGRDRTLTPDIAAVRQTLDLIVDGGSPVPGLAANADGTWGTTKNQYQYTWRSALGVGADGALYYVAGDNLTLVTLARAVAATGAVRGMELDIHSQQVHLFSYAHPRPGELHPAALLEDMYGARDRFLQPDLRDFIALRSR
jgi:hypothetical protein